MERIWTLVIGLYLLVGLGINMLMVQAQGYGAEGLDARDLAGMNQVCAALNEDESYKSHLAWGPLGSIDYDDTCMLNSLKNVFGDEMVMAILIKEKYLRVYEGEGLGPPLFYRQVTGQDAFYYRRGCGLAHRVAPFEAYDLTGMDYYEESIYRVEDELGIRRLDMEAGVRVFLSTDLHLRKQLGVREVDARREVCLRMKR